MLDGCEFSWAQVGIILKAAVAMANGFIGRDLFPESESFLLSALSTCKGNWLCAKAWKDLTSTEPPPEPTVIPDYTKVVNSPARQQWELFHKAHVRRWLVDAKPKRRPADAPPLQQVLQEPESATRWQPRWQRPKRSVQKQWRTRRTRPRVPWPVPKIRPQLYSGAPLSPELSKAVLRWRSSQTQASRALDNRPVRVYLRRWHWERCLQNR
mmetsp:Transcript_16742/g.44927  ORF Transcript_16742/g.44927 Transcript_16742/m.44927 type:complete len:211 (-) Transcript_16742:166-798(-)